jgi:hypothetical protein
MFWDDLVRRWRRESRLASARFLREAGGHVAVLPAPRRQRRSRLLLILLVFLAALAAALLGSGRISVGHADSAAVTSIPT